MSHLLLHQKLLKKVLGITNVCDDLVSTESRQQVREAQEGNEKLLSTPIDPHTAEETKHTTRTNAQCTEQLKAVLTLALNSAPKACWDKMDKAGRQPSHHLLENPIQHSSSLGALMVAELEHRLAAVNAPTASFGAAH
eukprot:COSAG02_NODE_899_length_16096_cov_19.762956_7_plen_138_part_00